MTIKFDVQLDKAVIAAGGFFCKGCLVGKPTTDRSPDLRYCQNCYEFLLEEAALLPANKRPAWIPKNIKKSEAKKAIPVQRDVVEVFARINKPEIHTCKNPPGRPVLDLPLDDIKRLADQGTGVTDILRYLKGQNVKVSRRTIYNILAGQRMLS